MNGKETSGTEMSGREMNGKETSEWLLCYDLLISGIVTENCVLSQKREIRKWQNTERKSCDWYVGD